MAVTMPRVATAIIRMVCLSGVLNLSYGKVWERKSTAVDMTMAASMLKRIRKSLWVWNGGWMVRYITAAQKIIESERATKFLLVALPGLLK